MKKIILPLLFIVSTLSAIAQNQRKNVVKAGVYIGLLNASYERILNSRHSVSLVPVFGFFSLMDVKYNVGGAGVDYRYYLPVLKGKAPTGFYLSPGISYSAGNASYKSPNGFKIVSDITVLAIKATAGYQQVFKNHLVIDVSAGTQYINPKFKGGGIFINDEDFTGYIPFVGVGVGYNF